jgi:KDO2-lipid IV(A) lauroyltransferase
MYYLFLILLYPLALLPMPVLYLISDFLYFIGYKMLGYRRKVTLANLQHAFPGKSSQELNIIMKQFYHHLFDQVVELIKLLAISEKELNRRVQGNWEVFRQLNDEGIDAYAMLGHTFNWEWANVACQYNAPQQFAGVYMPVKSDGLNRLMRKMRTRGGGWLISMKAKKGFQRLQGVRHIVGLIADQNPANMNGALWLSFMNREAPFYKGPELLARRAHAAVVFAGISRTGRGRYKVNLELVTKDASQLPQDEIIKKYVLFMERQLHAQPDNWLWTHRRWKHQRQIITS